MSEVPASADDLVEIAGPTAPMRRHFEYHVIYMVLAIVVLTLAATMSIEGGKQVTPPLLSTPLPELCYSRRLLNLDCPGCGMTRCFISLAHGDVVSAARYNLAGILFFGLVVAQIPYRAVQLWRIRRGMDELRPRRASTVIGIAIVVLLLSQWLLKLYALAVSGGL